MRIFLLSILALLACPLPAAAAPAAQPYSRHTSPTLQPFGEDEAFLTYLSEARAAAHARGKWWYDNPPASPAGLEVLPGSHGDYDFQERTLPGGGSLYYSQVDLTRIRPGVDLVWPGLRKRGRVLAGDEMGGPPDKLYDQARRNPLWSPGQIYRPVRDTLEPQIHSLTICTRRAVLGAHPSGCRTTAFIAPRGGELIVTATHAFVWSVPEYGDLEALKAEPDCRLRAEALEAEGLPSLVYRLPLAGGPLEVLGTRGSPAWSADYHVDDAHISSGRLRAFVAWPHLQCAGDPRLELDAPPARLTLLDAPLGLFGRRLEEVPGTFETRLPPAGSGAVLSSFIGEWLLYGKLSYEFAVPYENQPPHTARLFAAPLARPTQVRTVDLAHNIVAIVPAGGRVLITGYRDSTGLALSVVELGAEPRIVSTLDLPGLRQRGGDMGAIRAIPAPDGSVAIELPVDKIDAPHESGPASFRAVSIMTLRIDASGRLSASRTGPTPARLSRPISAISSR